MNTLIDLTIKLMVQNLDEVKIQSRQKVAFDSCTLAAPDCIQGSIILSVSVVPKQVCNSSLESVYWLHELNEKNQSLQMTSFAFVEMPETNQLTS